MTAQALYQEAIRRGLRLEPRGEKLAVIPADRVAPDFAELLRQHKPELLSWLEGQAFGLPPDQTPWIHVARQVLAGEFDGANRSTRESLAIGLRGTRHPLCRQALIQIECNGRPHQ